MQQKSDASPTADRESVSPSVKQCRAAGSECWRAVDCYGLQWVDKGHTEVWQGQETGVRNDAEERTSESNFRRAHVHSHTHKQQSASMSSSCR